MTIIPKHFSRVVAATALGLSLMSIASVSTWAASAATSAPTEASQDWAKQHQEWFKHMTDRMADRLEIKASQQNAWQAYVKVLESTHQPFQKNKPEVKTDAASIARMHAEFAAAHAQKLAQIADATAKLQEVLSPDQRKVLDEIVAHFGERHHHHHFGHHDGNHEGDGQWGHHRERGADDGSAHDQHEQH